MSQYTEPDEIGRTELSSPAENGSMREVDLDAAVTRQTPTRTRLIQFGVLLTLVLVFGGLVFRGYWAVQPQQTTVTTDDFSMSAAIFSNVNHGTLTVNATKLDVHPPVIVRLHSGTNTITISEPPFRPHTCTVDISRRSVDATQCTGAFGIPTMNIGGKHAATRIELPLTFTDLPSDQQQRVKMLVTQAIDGLVFHTTVPAHQYIATGLDSKGYITSRLTGQDLQADAALMRRADQASLFNSTCAENICAEVNVPYSPCGVSDASDMTDIAWKVTTFVTPQWRFTTQTGDTVAASSLSDSYNYEIEVPLRYNAAQGWRLWGVPGRGNICGVDNIMSNSQYNAGMNALSVYFTPDELNNVSPLAYGMEGSEIQVLAHSHSGDISTATFIWRFGVLLAADPAAHQLVPRLPVAPQAEIDAVTKQT